MVEVPALAQRPLRLRAGVVAVAGVGVAAVFPPKAAPELRPQLGLVGQGRKPLAVVEPLRVLGPGGSHPVAVAGVVELPLRAGENSRK